MKFFNLRASIRRQKYGAFLVRKRNECSFSFSLPKIHYELREFSASDKSVEAWKRACKIIVDERREGGKADYTVDQLRKLSGRLIFMNKNYSPILARRERDPMKFI